MTRLRKTQSVSEARPSAGASLPVRLLTRAALPSIAAISIALLQATTTMSWAPQDDPVPTRLLALLPLQIEQTDIGSHLTITGDGAMNKFSARMVGAWFELRIPNADASRVQRAFSGRGLEQGHVLQSGSHAVLLFRLVRGGKARVVPGAASLEIIVSVAAKPDTRADGKRQVYKNLLLPLRSGRSAGTAPTPADVNMLPDLPSARSLSKLSAEVAIAPLASISITFTSEPARVRIPDEPTPPPKPMVKDVQPPTRRVTLTEMSLLPIPTVPNDFHLPLLTVLATDDPPIPLRTKDVSVKADSAIETTPNASPTKAGEPTKETEPATTEAPKPAEIGDESAKMSDIEAAVVDPTKPSPAQINLPQTPLPQHKGRAPLSQEKRFELTGVISIDYSKTNQTTSPANGSPGDPIKNHNRNFGIGLDMHLGTFLIDPRFLRLSFDTGFTTNRGSFDEFSTRQGNKGAGLFIDFLPTSPYPFRFHYTRQNTHFLEQQISSASSGRRSVGFDWSLRKAKWPNLSLNFEDTSYASKFVASSSFKSQSRTFSLSLTDNIKGWDVNSNFSKQTATEGITDLKTHLDFLRFDARRQLSRKSHLFVNSFFEKLHFDNPRTRLGQDFSFFDVHTDYSLQQTNKLSFRAAYQFYYSSNDETATAGNSNASGEVNPPNPAAPKSVTSFNSAMGQMNYRAWPSLNFSTTASVRFINTPEGSAETAARFVDFTASVSWNKRLGFVETRANFVEGVTQVGSTLGQSRQVHFQSYSAGLSMGRVSRALVTADFNSTSRPDAFQIGGFFSQKNFNVAVETHALGRIRLRASGGENILDYVTASGREDLKTTTYSLSVDDKWFTVLLNHNSSSGVRDIFLVPVTINNTRIFRVLPVDSLVRDPLLNGAAVFTLGLVRIKPRNGLDIEARYLKDKVQFARTNNVFTQQFDVLARYKLGQVTLSSGLIFFSQETQELFSRNRNYFFFRVSRPFTLF